MFKTIKLEYFEIGVDTETKTLMIACRPNGKDGYIRDVTYVRSGISFRGCETYARDLSKVLIQGYLRIFFWGENYGDWFGIHIESNKAYYLEPVFAPIKPIEESQ